MGRKYDEISVNPKITKDKSESKHVGKRTKKSFPAFMVLVLNHANINISVKRMFDKFSFIAAPPTSVFHTRQSKRIKTNTSTFLQLHEKKVSTIYVPFVIVLLVGKRIFIFLCTLYFVKS